MQNLDSSTTLLQKMIIQLIYHFESAKEKT